MTSFHDGARGTYLPNGLRIVGRKAALVAETVTPPPVERLPQGRLADALYVLEGAVRPDTRKVAALSPLLDALTEEIRLSWPDCPPLLREGEQARTPSRFGGLSYRTLVEADGTWVGEVNWRSVHPMVSGAPITTTVILEEKRGVIQMSVRVTADDGLPSVRGYVGAGHAQPSFLSALRSQPFRWLDRPVSPLPIPLGGVEAWVRL